MRTGDKLRIWSDAEKEYLYAHREESVTKIHAGFCEEFGEGSRTYSATINQLTKLGLRNEEGRRRRWTEEEKEYLRNHLDDSIEDIVEAIGKSYQSVLQHHRKISPEVVVAKPRWTDAESNFLKGNCATIPLPLLSAKLEKSCAQIERRMFYLSLSLKTLCRRMETTLIDRPWHTWEYTFLKLNCAMTLRLLAQSLNRTDLDVVDRLREMKLSCKYSRPRILEPKVEKPKLTRRDPVVKKPELVKVSTDLKKLFQVEILDEPLEELPYQLSRWFFDPKQLLEMESWCVDHKIVYCIVAGHKGFAIFRGPLSNKD